MEQHEVEDRHRYCSRQLSMLAPQVTLTEGFETMRASRWVRAVEAGRIEP
jgi:hypothetical protein